MIHNCIDRFLPGNTPLEQDQSAPGEVKRGAAERDKLWRPLGRTLRIRFLDGNLAVQKKVIKVAQEWTQYANLKFVFADDPAAEIRISFRQSGSWSFIGTDALDPAIPPDQPTMNFGWLTRGTPNDEVRRVVLHEFGHALGLIHEHQNPVAAIPWNRAAVYDYYQGPPNDWSRAEVDANLFALYDAQHTQFTTFDPASIMLYPVPVELTVGGFAVGWNQTLSPTDIAFIASCYSFETEPTTPDANTESVHVGEPSDISLGLHQQEEAAKAMPALSIAQRFLNPRLLAQPFVDTQQVTPRQQRLHWNENCFDFPADLKEVVLQRLAAAKWSNYPNKMRPFDLIERLATTYHVRREMVAVSIGSSDLLRIILGAVLQPGDQMVTVTPTFYAYKLWGEVLGATVHTARLIPQNNFALPVDELLVLTRLNNAKLIVLCTPNNPTGTIYSLADLRRLAAESNALLLIDEAYAEFCGQDLRPLLHDFANVILLRTLSKAYALAGVRIGYALAAPAIGVELQKATTVFTLNCFAEIVANVALDHRERFLRMAQEIVAERERLAQALGALPGVHVFPSGANFLLARLDRPALPLCQQIMAEHQIVVAPMHTFPGMENYLRVSVGLPAVNQLLTATLTKLLK